MPPPLLIFSQSVYLIQAVDTNSNTELQTVQIQISWFLKKPTDLDLHCSQRQGISGSSRTGINISQVLLNKNELMPYVTSVCPASMIRVYAVWSLNLYGSHTYFNILHAG